MTATFPFSAPPPSLPRNSAAYSPPADLFMACRGFGDQYFNPCQPKVFWAPDPSRLPAASRYIVTVADLAQPF